MALPPTDKPPLFDYQTTGIIGGLIGALYGFVRMVKSWPDREPRRERETAMARRLDEAVSRLDSVEAAQHSINRQFDLMRDDIRGIGYRIDNWRR